MLGRRSAPTAPASVIVTARSGALHAEALRYLPGGTSRSVQDTKPPLYVREGQGCYVVDVDGNRYVDFYGNASALVHGHAHPVITEVAVDRVRRGTAFSLIAEEQLTLARMLCERVAAPDQRVRFANSGSEAVMLALKAARAHTGRPRIAKFEGCYHGMAEVAEVSLTPSPERWGDAGAPASVPQGLGAAPSVRSDVLVLPFNDLAATERLLRQHAADVAAVLLDLVPVYLGLISADPGFVRGLRSLTAELGIVLIADEVVSFRLAYGGAQALFDLIPDLTVVGKLIGGGFPVGALIGRSDIMAVFDASKGAPKVAHAGTFNANPVTCAAGIASLELFSATEIARIGSLAESLRRGVTEALAGAGIAGQVIGIGSLFRIHLTPKPFRNYREWWAASFGDPEVKRRQQQLYTGLLARGILLSSIGYGAVCTPMGEAEIEHFVDAFRGALADLS